MMNANINYISKKTKFGKSKYTEKYNYNADENKNYFILNISK